MYRKEIVYDRETKDYAMYLDGELVGFARTYHEAEVTPDQLVFELISGQYFTAARPAEVVELIEAEIDISTPEARDAYDAQIRALCQPITVEVAQPSWNGYTDPETGYDADDYPECNVPTRAALLETLFEDVQRWRENGGQPCDWLHVVETAEQIEASGVVWSPTDFPVEDEAPAEDEPPNSARVAIRQLHDAPGTFHRTYDALALPQRHALAAALAAHLHTPIGDVVAFLGESRARAAEIGLL